MRPSYPRRLLPAISFIYLGLLVKVLTPSFFGFKTFLTDEITSSVGDILILFGVFSYFFELIEHRIAERFNVLEELQNTGVNRIIQSSSEGQELVRGEFRNSSNVRIVLKIDDYKVYRRMLSVALEELESSSRVNDVKVLVADTASASLDSKGEFSGNMRGKLSSAKQLLHELVDIQQVRNALRLTIKTTSSPAYQSFIVFGDNVMVFLPIDPSGRHDLILALKPSSTLSDLYLRNFEELWALADNSSSIVMP